VSETLSSKKNKVTRDAAAAHLTHSDETQKSTQNCAAGNKGWLNSIHCKIASQMQTPSLHGLMNFSAASSIRDIEKSCVRFVYNDIL